MQRISAEGSLLDSLRKRREPLLWADSETPSLLIPLSRKPLPFGVFCFVLKRAVWNRADSAAAAAIAWQAAAAIRTLRQLQERESALARWGRFRRIVAEISAERHLPQLFRKIVRRGMELMDLDSGEIALWDAAQEHFVVRSAANLPAGSRGSTFRMGEGISGMAARTGKTIIFHRERSLPASRAARTPPYPIMIGTPIRIGDRTLGVLTLHKKSGRKRISEQDRVFLEALANQSAIAIDAIGASDSYRRELIASEVLRKTGIELSAELDRSSLLDAILHRGAALSGLEVGWLALLDPEGSLRVEKGIDVSPGFIGKKIKLGEGFVGRAVQERKILSVDPRPHGGEPLFEEARQLSLEGAVVAPMIWKRKILGVLCLGTRDPRRRVSRPEHKIVEAFSLHAAASLANVLLFESLYSEKEQYRKNLEARVEELNLLHEEQARKEKLAALGQIVGSVNHELRQPLEVITNAVYYLKMQLERNNEFGPVKKEFERFLAIISDECKSATDLVNELLDFTRKKEAVSIQVDMNQLLENQLRRVQLPEKVRIKTNFSRKSPVVFIDPIQVSRALNNFILNGIQAMTQGGTLLVATHVTRKAVEVVIRDTGEGIAPENMRRIFEPLFTTKARGVGLGLALAKQYLEASHGQINVESQVGVGTTFRVSFPRLQAG